MTILICLLLLSPANTPSVDPLVLDHVNKRHITLGFEGKTAPQPVRIQQSPSGTHYTYHMPKGLYQLTLRNGKVVQARLTPWEQLEPSGVQEKRGQGDQLDTEIRRKRAAEIRTAKKAAGKRASGTLTVFDPDPRTTLMDETLQDHSPASAFTAAYQQKSTDQILEENGVYRLENHVVAFVDLDLPANNSGQNTSGVFDGVRGVHAFLEANVFHHLNQSAAYVEALGFDIYRGRQSEQLLVDVAAHGGLDYTSYDPASSTLFFGEGCVDDAEDADTIHHMYFRHMANLVNPDWASRRDGIVLQAMADYWAASYSYGTENGPNYQPGLIFNWDGHGAGTWCWEGRRLDRHDAFLDRITNFYVGQDMGGFLIEELFGTAMFQGMLELVEAGTPKAEVDRIYLDALFNAPPNAWFFEMSGRILLSAETLYPDGPHYQILFDRFNKHGLIRDASISIQQMIPSDFRNAGSNRMPDPGESFQFRFRIRNHGSETMNNVTATLFSPTDAWTLHKNTVTFTQIQPGVVTASDDFFDVTVSPLVSCARSYLYYFQDIPFVELTWKDRNGEDQLIRRGIDVRMGTPRFPRFERDYLEPIPDATGEPAVVRFRSNLDGLASFGFRMGIRVRHSYPSDLRLVLTTPAGDDIEIRNYYFGDSGSISWHISGLSRNPLHLDGEFKLSIYDDVPVDSGVLLSWWMEDDEQGFECAEPLVRAYDHDTWFPFSENGSDWSTELSLINTVNGTNFIEVRGYDLSGNLIDAKPSSLSPNGAMHVALGDLLENSDQVAYLHVASSEQLHGYSHHVNGAKDRSMLLTGINEPFEQLIVPHVAEDPSFWTTGRIINLNEEERSLQFSNQIGNEPLTLPMGGLDLDMTSLFPNPIPLGTGLGTFYDPTDAFPTYMAGVELFGNNGAGSMAAGVSLEGFADTRMLIPHIPADQQSFWTGVVLVNPGAVATEVTLEAYDSKGGTESGRLVHSVKKTLAPMSKIVGTVQSLLGVDDLSADFLVIDSVEPITGYQLIGATNNQGDLSAIRGLHSYDGVTVFPTVRAEDEWLGYAVINPFPFSIYLSVYERNAEGYIINLERIDIRERNKYVFTPNDTPGLSHIWIDGGRRVSFMLRGSNDGDRLSGGVGADRTGNPLN